MTTSLWLMLEPRWGQERGSQIPLGPLTASTGYALYMLDEKYVILVVDGVTISGIVESEADFDPETLAEWRALGKAGPVVLLRTPHIPGALQQDDMDGEISAKWLVIDRERVSAMAITGESSGKKTLAALRARRQRLDQSAPQNPDQQS